MFILNFCTSCVVKRGLSFSYLTYRTKELKEVNQRTDLVYLRYHVVLSLMSPHEVLSNFVLGIYKADNLYNVMWMK
jgi:hypothetical protein